MAIEDVLQYFGLLAEPWYGLRIPLPPMALMIVLLYAIWSLRCGYRNCLRIPHSVGVAVASQMIALPASVIITGLLAPRLAESVLIWFLRTTGTL